MPDRYAKNLLYESDPFFQACYREGSEISRTPDAVAVAPFSKRQERFYNLSQFLLRVLPINGAIAECGCWKGLSSYILCHYIKHACPDFRGHDYIIVDSFEGLSEPSAFDAITDVAVTGKAEKSGQPAGTYAASMDHVSTTLSGFPGIRYYKGWIPPVLKELPEAHYKFVHVDVDLHDPIDACIRYFFPRLVREGVMVFDDYGSLYWPGAKKAVDDYCDANGIPLLRLSTGQAVIWK